MFFTGPSPASGLLWFASCTLSKYNLKALFLTNNLTKPGHYRYDLIKQLSKTNFNKMFYTKLLIEETKELDDYEAEF